MHNLKYQILSKDRRYEKGKLDFVEMERSSRDKRDKKEDKVNLKWIKCDMYYEPIFHNESIHYVPQTYTNKREFIIKKCKTIH